MKKKKAKIFLCLIGVLAVILAICLSAYADVSDEEAIRILESYPFEHINIFSYVFRYLGWWISSSLCWVVSEAEKSITLIISMAEKLIFGSSEVQNLFSNIIFPIAFIGLLLVLAFIGFNFMIKGKVRAEAIQNLIIGVIVIFLIPFGMSKLFTMTQSAVEALGLSDTSLADSILKENVTDNLLYDSSGYPKEIPNVGNNIESISSINVSEVVHSDQTEYGNIWNKDIKYNANNTKELIDISTFKLLNIGDEIDILGSRYYRYNIDFFTIIVTELVTLVALIFTAIKVARLLFELLIHQALADVFAFIDIHSGQRLKKCLQSMLATFATVFCCMLMFKLYIIGNNYLADFCYPKKLYFVYLIGLIAFAWALIDGPNIVEQLIGVDAGLHSAVRTYYGLSAAGKVITAPIRGISRITGRFSGKNGVQGGSVVENQSSFGEERKAVSAVKDEVSNIGEAEKKAEKDNIKSHAMPNMRSAEDGVTPIKNNHQTKSSQNIGEKDNIKSHAMPNMRSAEDGVAPIKNNHQAKSSQSGNIKTVEDIKTGNEPPNNSNEASKTSVKAQNNVSEGEKPISLQEMKKRENKKVRDTNDLHNTEKSQRGSQNLR